ncbi:tripartite tricarboxylate transporter substrate binding protein [Acuticoccus sediminis]|uniref:Tripartite tricarboxylate transporter substrate binding protein n=1 Tax=Acuticoccus sediminis TaxID=2184697 RepID=A0A8B2NXT3_9HYPH|nr:tripartite tricarboxylate transporter substrate binding protein [Acuticoccus sediminis]RAI02172.1 tripartite tricarboxylate transporter substrate binding protein [Acuticoccus sediminis]
MTRLSTAAALAALLIAPAGALLVAPSGALAEDWSPAEPVTIIVPWSAGGSTDTVTRVIAKELTDAIGQNFVIVNQPGASGSVGTRSVWEAPHDGMTMAAGAAADLGAYPVFGSLDATIADWRLYLDVANPAMISVPADSEWEDFGAFLEALTTAESPMTVSSGGLSSATAITMQALEKVADVKYRQIVYEGGNPAVISTVAGETDFTAQNATEQVDMVRAGRLRPLAVVASSPLELAGYGSVPAITDWLPEIATAPNYFGIFVPADAPKEVLDTMDKVWAEKIANSEALKTFAAERAALFAPSYGEEAHKAAMPFLSINAWQQFNSGAAPNEPTQFGIPKPE